MTEKAEQWKMLMKKWQQSEISGAQWCRENGLSYATFTYWKKRLLIISANSAKLSFTEITSQSEDSGIHLSLGNLTIKLSPCFDPVVLKRFLKILKDI